MENNWRKIALEVLQDNHSNPNGYLYRNYNQSDCIDAMLEFGNLVFEATKKECADKAESKLVYHSNHDDPHDEVNKESILNINKPNL